MKCTKLFLLACLGVFTSFGISYAQVLPASDIQEQIDAADSGDIVYVPAGVYAGSLHINKDITLLGEGAESTVLQVPKGKKGVKMGNGAIIAGFKIQGASIAIHANDSYVGVFNCHIKNTKGYGLYMIKGSGLVYGNEFEGPGKVGLMCFNSNPYVIENVFAEQDQGVLVDCCLKPMLIGNVFINNNIAVNLRRLGQAYLGDNTFEGNVVDVKGKALSADDADQSDQYLRNLRWVDFGSDPALYRDILEEVHEHAIRAHGSVIYDLADPVNGIFHVNTYHPRATFTVKASAKDTIIEDYEATDLESGQSLSAAKVTKAGRHPRVVAKNPELTAIRENRYCLDQTYTHPASLHYTTGDDIHFKRATNMANTYVVLPLGYVATSVNFPYEESIEDGRVVLKMTQIGLKTVELDLVRQ